MVVTRSQAGEEITRGRVFVDPPQSPSATDPNTRAGRSVAETQNVPTVGPATEPHVTNAPPAPTTSRIQHATGSVRSGRSRMTTSSAAALRIKQAELAAEEKLAEIKRRELRLEADLVQKKLAFEVANIQAEESDAESVQDQPIDDRVSQWLRQQEPTNTSSLTLRDRAPAFTNAAAARQPPIAAEVATPARADVTHPHPLRGERTPANQERTTDEHEARPRAAVDDTPRPQYERPRSPSPTYHRSRSTGRGIEQLAEAIGRIAKMRPPPRQVIELPIFTGAPGEWLPFKAAIRDSSSIYEFSDVENMARLRNSLKGEARQTVQALLHTSRDPELILKTLEQCYGRPEIIVDQALDEIKRLPRPGNSASELNNLAVKLQNIVHVLNSLDQRGYLHNPMLTREVVDKLSPHLRSRWCDYAEDFGIRDEPQIVTISKFLMKEADRALKHAYTPSTAAVSKGSKSTSNAPTARQRETIRRTATYATATADTADEEKCLYCGARHKVPQCDQYRALNTDQRWQWIKEKKICFKCVNKTHRRSNCRAKPCGVDGCQRPHHSTLHATATATSPTTTATPTTTAAATPSDDGTVLSVRTTNNIRTVLLKMCPITVAGPRGEVKTFALLDEGSTATLIDEELAQKLDARGPASALRIHGVNSTRRENDSRHVKIQVKTGGRAWDIKARTVKGLKLTGQTIPSRLLDCDHLRDLPVENLSYEQAIPKILIGADNWEMIVTRELRTGRKHEPVASKTQLGWVIHGTAPRAIFVDEASVLHLRVTNEKENELHEAVKEHFKIDSLGVTLSTKMRPEDKRALDIFDKTIAYRNGRYEVGLTWKEDAPAMPSSYDNAVRRLKNIEKKMDRDPMFAKEYNAQMENLIKKGYAEESDGSEKQCPYRWYLPHFAVSNPNKPGKIRLVFDAAAVTNGTSLNEQLLEGPDLLLSLLGILFKFRELPVAVTADIEEMFLRVKIRNQDQPAQMFLWRGNERKTPPREMKMTSMIFGATCSPFLAHSVRNHNARAHKHTHPAAFRAITESHYMDDFVDSYATSEDAAATIKQLIEVHSRAGFKLRSWNSNREGALIHVPSELRARTATQLGHENKTLGLIWDPKEDELGFNTTMPRVPTEVRARTRAPTKREALSAIMSVYDPLGLLSCFTISAKIFLQRLWRLQIGWDEPLPEEHAEDIMNWLKNLEHVNTLRLPRCYDSKQEHKKRQLHVFCDASQDAFAAAAYWRLEKEDGTADVVLAVAKSKVAPIKSQSIPRLELQAALIGTRLADTVLQGHRWSADEVIYWSDSRTVLHWIRKDARRHTPFVAHRLGEIAERSEINQWRWIPTELNVADTATRSNYVPADANDWWFTGPTFLRHKEETWPEEPTTPEIEQENTETINYACVERQQRPLPDINRFSSLSRLLRATASVLLFIDKCRGREREMTARHLECAEKLWLTQAQQESFPEEIARLRAGKPLARASRLAKLDPEIGEDGLIRVRGRLGAAQLPNHTKRPVILDGRHPLARLIVLREHVNAGHAARERVVNDLRQRYWILRLRPTVRAVAHACALCRVRKARPNVLVCGDLPTARLDPYHRPFTNCGLDYFGPMMVTIGRRREKRWGALFTCLTTRAVHLELVGSLTTDSAIMALRRMAARRGWPSVIYSDNATNFKGADAELRAAYAEWAPALREYGLKHLVTWRYIAPGAPNQGGAWERLVRSVKVALSAALNEKTPKEEVLQTVLAEAEYSVNARPLTHVSVEPDDPEALTPNHFLLGSSQGLPTTGPCSIADKRTWRASQALADEFWRRWVKEYLPTLVARGGSRNQETRPLQEGDLVVVVDAALPRNTWPRGVVEKVFPGPDGGIRSAEIRTRGGIFRRPTSRLAVLPVERAPQSLRRGEDEEDSKPAI